MKTLKNLKCVALLFAIILLLVGCFSAKDKNEDYYVFENFQTLEQYQHLKPEHQNLVKKSLDTLSIKEGHTIIQNHILSFLKDNTTTTLKNLMITEDNLSLCPGANGKPIANLVLEIYLEMDTQNITDAKEISREIVQDLRTSLQNNLYFVLKASNITFEMHNLSGGVLYTLLGNHIQSGQNEFAVQDPKELQAQTLAYHYNSDFLTLEKFGIENDLRTLQVSYYLKDRYFENNAQSHVEDLYHAFTNYFLSSETAQAYLNENQLTSIAVSFRNDNFFEEAFNFTLEI